MYAWLYGGWASTRLTCERMDQEQRLRAAQMRLQVNEKMIVALIGLLTARDKDLLQELDVVFRMAEWQAGHEEVDTPREVWGCLRAHMRVLKTMAARWDGGGPCLQ